MIENGSPLFNGSTASGESQIRRWILENDLVEAIIALPTELFYNTEIATYIWVMSKNKRTEREGKIQLIDASSIYHKLRKGLGKKKNEITPDDRSIITKLYADFQECEDSRIFKNEDFIYKEYVVMQPLQRSYAITEERIQYMLQVGSLNSLYDEGKANKLQDAEELTGKEKKKLDGYLKNQPTYEAIIETLKSAISGKKYLSEKEFIPVLTQLLSSIISDKKLIDKIAKGLSEMDKTAEIQKDRKGNVIYDKDTKDIEIIPFEEDIDHYMEREVLPYVPDAKAFWEENLSAKKPIIKIGAEWC